MILFFFYLLFDIYCIINYLVLLTVILAVSGVWSHVIIIFHVCWLHAWMQSSEMVLHIYCWWVIDESYANRLRKLKLPTLAYRRARGDLIKVYKHIHIYENDIIQDTLRIKNRIYQTRKHNFQLAWNKPKDGVRGIQTNSFHFQVVKHWNDLPANVVDSKSLDAFKKNLAEFCQDNPIKYNYKVNRWTDERFIEALNAFEFVIHK